MSSMITIASVRVAGEIPIEISARHLGTDEQEAGMRMGELLVYVRSAHVAERVGNTWRQAKPVVARLPDVAGVGRLRLPVRVALVGMIVRLGGEPACTVVGVPGRCGVSEPAHVRIQVGPLVWEVCDRVAWHAISRAWVRLHRQLADPEV